MLWVCFIDLTLLIGWQDGHLADLYHVSTEVFFQKRCMGWPVFTKNMTIKILSVCIIDTAWIVCGRVYAMVQCVSVCRSVCPIYRLQHAAAARLLLWAWSAGHIDWYWQLPGAAAAQWIVAHHSAANASDVMLSADVGIQTVVFVVCECTEPANGFFSIQTTSRSNFPNAASR